MFVRSKPCPATSAEADGLFLLGPNLTSRKTTTTQPTQVHCCRRQGSPWLRGGVVADKRKGCVARTTSKTMPPPPVTFPIFMFRVPPRTFCGAASGRFRRFPADFGFWAAVSIWLPIACRLLPAREIDVVRSHRHKGVDLLPLSRHTPKASNYLAFGWRRWHLRVLFADFFIFSHASGVTEIERAIQEHVDHVLVSGSRMVVHQARRRRGV